MSTVNGFQVGSEILKYNYESLENYNTPNFSTSSTDNYTVGDYVMYNGKLYKCTTATTGGTWVSENWTEAVLSDDVSDLSRQLNDKQDAPSSAGTAGQVLGLDDQLQPVWTDGGSSEDAAPVIINTASGDIASFADGADNRQIRKIVGTIVPVQSGTGDPSPDNVRPISGRTGANIYGRNANIATFSELIPRYGTSSSGVNLTVSNGKMTFSGTATAGGTKFFGSFPTYAQRVFQVKAGVTYCVSSKNTGNAWIQGNIAYDDGTTSSGWIQVDSTAAADRKYGIFTPAKNGRIAFLPVATLTSGQEFNATIEDIQLTPERTAVYKGEAENIILPINWQSEAGTVYGGTVTLNEDGSADVVVTQIKMTMTEYFAESGRNIEMVNGYLCRLYALSTITAPIICNTFKTVTGKSWGYFPTVTGNECQYSGGYLAFASSTLGFTTKAEWEAYLKENVEICATLATPQTYHFSNIGSLLTYYGQNNVWIDTGAITECDYPADTKLYLTARDEEITGNIAPIENGATASQAYAQGAYFWHDTKFCKALAAIASGATFTLGTNYTITTVAAELLAAQN